MLRESVVPPSLRPLVPMAERWGIGDDVIRSEAVEAAPIQDLEALASCFDDVSDDELDDWLAGPESYDEEPSPEYLAFSCLLMAMDLAKLLLARNRSAE